MLNAILVWPRSAATSSSCFLLDSAGIVFAPALIYSGDAYQKYYGVVVGDTLPRQFLDKERFYSLQSLINALQKKQHLRVQTVTSDIHGDVRLTFDGDFAVIFAMTANKGDVFERFGLALMAAPFAARPLSDFEYLDLRFGDTLYYKLKGTVTSGVTHKK